MVSSAMNSGSFFGHLKIQIHLKKIKRNLLNNWKEGAKDNKGNPFLRTEIVTINEVIH